MIQKYGIFFFEKADARFIGYHNIERMRSRRVPFVYKNDLSRFLNNNLKDILNNRIDMLSKGLILGGSIIDDIERLNKFPYIFKINL